MPTNRFTRRVRRLLPKVRRHGLARVVYSSLLKKLQRGLRLKVLRCQHLARAAPAFLDAPETYAATFLTRSSIRDLARDAELEVSARFVREALAKGDKCYGVTQDGWLSA